MPAMPYGAGMLSLIRSGVQGGRSDAMIHAEVQSLFPGRATSYVQALIGDERRDWRAWTTLASYAERNLVANVAGLVGGSTVNPDGSAIREMRTTVTLYYGEEGYDRQAFDVGINIRASGNVRSIFADAITEAIQKAERIFNDYPELLERYRGDPSGWYFSDIRPL